LPHPSAQPPLTDAAARIRAIARARLDEAGFLHDEARSELEERLADVNRTFTAPAIVTPFGPAWSGFLPGARVVAQDAVLDLAPGRFDLVIHAMGLHWADDPVGQIAQCRRALRPDGLFLAVCLGGETLHELRAALAAAEAAVLGGLSPRVAPMAEIRDLGALLPRAGLALPVADRAMLHADNAYDLPACRIVSHRLRTNTQSATAFRGFGGPQGMVGIERVMDHIAHHLDRDPADVRRLNHYPEAQAGPRTAAGGGDPARIDGGEAGPSSGGPAGRGGVRSGGARAPAAGAAKEGLTPYGMPVRDFILGAMTDRLAADCGYLDRRARLAAWNAANPILKRGIALTPVKFGISFTLTHLNQAGALVHVYRDGSVHLNHGGTEMGQGLFRKVAQVAAARFGIAPERIRITATDTGKVPNTSATAASSGTDLNGMAVRTACDTIRARIAEVAAEALQAEAGDVRFEDGTVRAGSAAMPFEAAVQRAYMARVSLSATGFYRTPKIEWDRIAGRGRPFLYFAYGVACSEVAIDTLTGENRMLRTDILHDCGRSLNPALDIGQIEGGFVQGAGWLTTEELVWDASGRLRTHAPSTYKIPACSDRPDIFNVALWDGANPEDTIYRSKAVGEPPLMLGISVLSALGDACAACGPHFPDLQAPATAEAVLAAVARARACPRSG